MPWFDCGSQSHLTEIGPTSHRSHPEPLCWLKCCSVDPLGSHIGFRSKAFLTYFDSNSRPQWCWPKCCLISRLTLLWLGGGINQPSEGCSDLKYSVSLWLGKKQGRVRHSYTLIHQPNLCFQWKKDGYMSVLWNFRCYLTTVLAYLFLLPYDALIMLQHRLGQAPNPRVLSSPKECFQDFSPVNTGA